MEAQAVRTHPFPDNNKKGLPQIATGRFDPGIDGYSGRDDGLITAWDPRQTGP
jgi:hypothetical protein